MNPASEPLYMQQNTSEPSCWVGQVTPFAISSRQHAHATVELNLQKVRRSEPWTQVQAYFNTLSMVNVL